MVNKVIGMLVLFMLVPSVCAQVVITEIKPQSNEFVEIKDFDSFHNGNISEVRILDSNGNLSYNTLSLLKKTNSSLSLLVGSSFEDSNDLENFNCSIYKTSGTQVSKGGLLSGGEELQIVNHKNTLSLSWIPPQDFDLLENQSIDAIFDVATVATPCTYNPLPTSKIDIEEITSQLCSCPDFSLDTNTKITNDTIAYTFTTNATTNASVEYWVEHHNGSLVKEKITTTHFTTKYFTPSKMGIYTIFAKLISGDCIVKKYQDVMYYQPPSSQEVVENSSIVIENKDELISFESSELHYTITRGNTAKRAVKFYFKGDEFATLYVQKYSQISGRLTLPYLLGGLLEVKGLGINMSVMLSKKTSQKTSQSKIGGGSGSSSSPLTSQTQSGIQKMSLDVINISQKNESVLFLLQSTHNGTIECSIVDYRTKVSSLLKKEIPFGKSFHKLSLDKQKIIERKNASYELFCKYKKSHLKTFSSTRVPLSISFNQNKTIGVENGSSSSLETSSPVYTESPSTQKNTSSIQFVSKQTTLKSYVIYIIATVLFVIIGLFLVFRNK